MGNMLSKQLSTISDPLHLVHVLFESITHSGVDRERVQMLLEDMRGMILRLFQKGVYTDTRLAEVQLELVKTKITYEQLMDSLREELYLMRQRHTDLMQSADNEAAARWSGQLAQVKCERDAMEEELLEVKCQLRHFIYALESVAMQEPVEEMENIHVSPAISVEDLLTRMVNLEKLIVRTQSDVKRLEHEKKDVEEQLLTSRHKYTSASHYWEVQHQELLQEIQELTTQLRRSQNVAKWSISTEEEE